MSSSRCFGRPRLRSPRSRYCIRWSSDRCRRCHTATATATGTGTGIGMTTSQLSLPLVSVIASLAFVLLSIGGGGGGIWGMRVVVVVDAYRDGFNPGGGRGRGGGGGGGLPSSSSTSTSIPPPTRVALDRHRIQSLRSAGSGIGSGLLKRSTPSSSSPASVGEDDDDINQTMSPSILAPARPLSPPFPDGPSGGTMVTLSEEDVFGDGGTVDIGFAGRLGSALPGLNSDSLLLPPRPISVWLPPGYHSDTHLRYPVLYCHDGQNAVSDASSWTGHSWRLPGALTRLAERNMLRPVAGTAARGSSPRGISPVPIVVLMPSADGSVSLGPMLPSMRRRHLEYGDATNPIARAHVDLVTDTIKPMIDDAFRTVRSYVGTYAIGSSLGGQAAFHMLMRRPDVFGGAAALSPAFQPGTLALVASSLRELNNGGGREGKTLYLDNGGDVQEDNGNTDGPARGGGGSGAKKVPWFDVNDHLTEHHWWNPGFFWLDTHLQPGVDAMRFALDVGGVSYAYHREAGARHNERAWSRRIHRPLMHLFGPRDVVGSAGRRRIRE